MPTERFMVFEDINTGDKIIVNMVTNEHLSLEDACKLLNKQDKEITQLKKEG